MSDPTPLGALLRERRKARRVSWKRLSAVTGLEPETMMLWERGVTRDPPIGKVLLFGREVGLDLDDLAGVVLGEPYRAPHHETANGAGSDPYDPLLAIEGSGAAASDRAARKGTSQQSGRRMPRR
jgi:transcriptional regulator with XRE-family HTH domain